MSKKRMTLAAAVVAVTLAGLFAAYWLTRWERIPGVESQMYWTRQHRWTGEIQNCGFSLGCESSFERGARKQAEAVQRAKVSLNRAKAEWQRAKLELPERERAEAASRRSRLGEFERRAAAGEDKNYLAGLSEALESAELTPAQAKYLGREASASLDLKAKKRAVDDAAETLRRLLGADAPAL